MTRAVRIHFWSLHHYMFHVSSNVFGSAVFGSAVPLYHGSSAAWGCALARSTTSPLQLASLLPIRQCSSLAHLLLEMRALGISIPYVWMPYATGEYREDFAGQPGIAGNYYGNDGRPTTWWIIWMVSMYNLNYSSAEPRGDQLHWLVDNCLSMLQSFTGQIRCCLLKCWNLLVEDKETRPMWYWCQLVLLLWQWIVMFISLLVDIRFDHTSCFWFQRNCSLALHRDVHYRSFAWNCFILSKWDQTSLYPECC